jgi:small subunit ribosomal protein S8
MITDPIADMLSRIRNANIARHEYVDVPASKLKLAITQTLKREGFVRDFEMVKSGAKQNIRIHLVYAEKKEPVITGLQRVSRPGLRVYSQRGAIPRVYGGLGVAIMSTPQGVVTGKEAWRRNVGGEILCYVW